MKALITIATLLLIVVNATIATKYSMRMTPHYIYIVVAYTLLLIAIIKALVSKKELKGKATAWFYVAVIVLIVAMIALQYSLDPMQNRVDRWSAIAYPLSFLFNGEFPYLAQTHLGGNASPFPVWMIVHIPFYFLGNVGLSEMFSSLLFLFSVKYAKGSMAALKATILLAISIGLWYETAVRSDLISNFLLLAAFINVFQYKHIDFCNHPFALAVCAGLWLSTRLSVAFPLFIFFFISWLRLPINKKIVTLLIVIATFWATFLPLIIWDFDNLFFAENNPFSLQSRQGRPVDAFILAAIAVLMAMKAGTNSARQMLYSAVMLLLTTLIAYTHDMIICGTWAEIFSSRYDISYLDAAIPFLIMVIVGNKYTIDSKCI